MATRMVRPLSLRFSIPDELSAVVETVLQGFRSFVGDGCVDCLTQTRRISWQVTVNSVEAKDRLLFQGFKVKVTYVSCLSIEPDVVLVTGKMPFEMADSPISTILSAYGTVTSVRRLTYSFARSVETGCVPLDSPMLNLVQSFPEFSLWKITSSPQGPRCQDSPEFAFFANSRDITSKTLMNLDRLALVQYAP